MQCAKSNVSVVHGAWDHLSFCPLPVESLMPIITHTVTDKHVGKRLDIYIGHYEPQLSRNRIQS